MPSTHAIFYSARQWVSNNFTRNVIPQSIMKRWQRSLDEDTQREGRAMHRDFIMQCNYTSLCTPSMKTIKWQCTQTSAVPNILFAFALAPNSGSNSLFVFGQIMHPDQIQTHGHVPAVHYAANTRHSMHNDQESPYLWLHLLPTQLVVLHSTEYWLLLLMEASIWIFDWVKVLHLNRHKIGHFRDVLASQYLALLLKKTKPKTTKTSNTRT